MIFFLNTLLLLHSIDDNFEMEGCKSCRFSQLLATVILAQKIVVSLGLAMTNLAFCDLPFYLFSLFLKQGKWFLFQSCSHLVDPNVSFNPTPYKEYKNHLLSEHTLQLF